MKQIKQQKSLEYEVMNDILKTNL